MPRLRLLKLTWVPCSYTLISVTIESNSIDDALGQENVNKDSTLPCILEPPERCEVQLHSLDGGAFACTPGSLLQLPDSPADTLQQRMQLIHR